MSNLLRLSAFVVAVFMARGARAEEPVPVPSTPPIMSTEEAAPVSMGAGVLDQLLKVDVGNHITEGRERKSVSHRELFERMGRADLLAQSDSMISRRKALLISGAAVAAVGIGVGIALIATAPRLASVECESDVRVYNEICVPAANRHNISGTAAIAAGVVTGVLLATLAYWSNPDVLDRDQTAALIGTFNAQVVKRFKSQPSSLKFLPIVTGDGAWLAASLRF